MAGLVINEAANVAVTKPETNERLDRRFWREARFTVGRAPGVFIGDISHVGIDDAECDGEKAADTD